MDYKKYYQEYLYPLQDKVLNRIWHTAPEFYLTGGTALGRFYLKHRYSDDIDLFVNRSTKFSELTGKVIKELQKEFQNLRIQLSDTDFVRLIVAGNDTELKVEFINDVGFHFHPVVIEESNILDSWQNILSNKICALSRNAAKDYADILYLALSYSFNWADIYDAAKQKDTWVNEITSGQVIDKFDIKRLSDIRWINENINISEFENHYHIIAKDILMAADNSLYKKPE